MWSSTASTASTLPFDEDWACPAESEVLNTCYKDRDFFQPTKEFDDTFVFNVFGNCKKKNIFPKSDNQEDEITNSNDSGAVSDQEKVIQEWAKKNLYNDDRTNAEIFKDNKENNKQIKKAIQNFYTCNIPWYVPFTPGHSELPYLKRSFCYPKVMCNLGWNLISTKSILQHVQQGILLFLIDIRFGRPEVHKKIVDHLQLARHTMSKGVYTERIFGFAFQIHGRKLSLGLMYKNQDVFLDRDSTIILTADRRWSDRGTHNVVYVNFWDYVSILQIGDEIKIGPNVIVIINGKTERNVICTVKRDGIIRKRMPVQFPINRRLCSPPEITKEEEEDIGLAISLGCDFLISPCVTKKLVAHVNWVVAVRNRIVKILHVAVFDKRLTKEKVDCIYKLAHGIVIYGNGQNEDNDIREYIVKESYALHKLIIRSGFMSTVNCIERYDKQTLKHLLFYPDCIVCSPSLYDMTEIKSVIRKLYPTMNEENFRFSLGPICSQDKSLEFTFCKYIISSSYYGKFSCIIVANNNGQFTKLLSDRRPLVPIISSFLDLPTARICLISRNVYSTIYRAPATIDWNEQIALRLKSCIKFAKRIGCLHLNEPFFFCYDSMPGLRYCDTVRILLANKNM